MPTSALRATADKILERKRSKIASGFVQHPMFEHPVAVSTPSRKTAGLRSGAIVGGVSGAHGAVRSGGGAGSAVAGGLVGSLVGDAVYVAITQAILRQSDTDVRKMAIPVALLASAIAGQVSGSVTKKWLVGDAKKETK